MLADENAAVLLEWAASSRSELPARRSRRRQRWPDGDYRIPAHRPDAGEEQANNATRLREALVPEPGEAADEWIDRAGETISDHEYGVCVHGDGSGRGRRRSSHWVLRTSIGTRPGRHAETPYRPVEGQI